jgi:hypothetical protein
MKTLIIVLSAGCAVLAGYFGVRYFTRRDLGFTSARNYVQSLAKNLLHTERTAAREAGTTPEATTEQAAWQTVPLMLVAATLTDVKGEAACYS